MKEIEDSKIIGFCKEVNKNILLYFYDSKAYKAFSALNAFFGKTALKNANGSIFVKAAKKIAGETKPKDIGLFIVLVVIFNTSAVIVLGKEIDIFSVSARIFFFLLGIFLIFKRR
jgi:hypothetical protein